MPLRGMAAFFGRGSEFSSVVGGTVLQTTKRCRPATSSIRSNSTLEWSEKKVDKKSTPQTVNLSYVAYEQRKNGSNQPPILIHHGLLGRKENWARTGRELGHLTNRKIVIPDARNHGNSPNSREMTHKQMSGDLVGLLNHLEIKQTNIIGHSLGGRIAMYTALTRPELVNKLIIISSSPLNTIQELKRWEILNQACHVICTLQSNTLDAPNSIEFKLEAEKALKKLIPASKQRALFISNLGKVNQSAILGNPDLWKFPDLDNYCFNKPVLFLRGSEETPWNADGDAGVRKIRHLFPNSHFAQLNGKAPFLHNINDEEHFLEAIITFLQSAV